MSAYADMAAAAMKASLTEIQKSFLPSTNLCSGTVKWPPEVYVNGALRGWKYNLIPPKDLTLPVDLLMQFSIGDFLTSWPCSSYFDPSSPWFNVFYGSYTVRSGKPDGTPWGFDKQGNPKVDEFLEIPRIDYTYLTAGMFGCPPEGLDFQASWGSITPVPGGGTQAPWYQVAVEATIPSGLHRVPSRTVDYPLAYLMYGVPNPAFVDGKDYQPVQMRGTLFLKLTGGGDKPWITLAWGALCPDTGPGQALLSSIMTAMSAPFL